MPRDGRSRGPIAAPILTVAIAIVLGCARPAFSQIFNQVSAVYPDDSIVARETLIRARELSEGGSEGEAVRVLQAVLDRESEKVLEAQAGSDLFIPVRRHVHDLLLSLPGLLEKYRLSEEAPAAALLARHQHEEVERTRLLTRSGLTAALRVAQRHMEAARFDAAWLTLRQLDAHPDRKGDSPGGVECARLAMSLARFSAVRENTELARRWAREAKLTIHEEPHAVLAEEEPARSPLEPGSPVRSEDIPKEPLQSVELRLARDASAVPDVARRARAIATPSVFPTIAGDLALLNDGTRISAYDRQTLSLVWQVTPPAVPGAVPDPEQLAQPIGFSTPVEDVLSTAVSGGGRGGVVVACTGLPVSGRRSGDARVHGVDLATGEILWSVDPAGLDAALRGASVRGPAVIDADTVVLTLRKPGTFTRVSGLYMVGLDLYSGSMRWMRLVASVGRLPWNNTQRRADATLLHKGILYRADDMGAVAAYEAVTGRPVWVRRVPPNRGVENRFARPDTQPAYTITTPIMDGEAVIVQEPGDGRVLRLDASTGRVLGQRDASALDSPRYLVRVGDYLAGVGGGRIALLKLGDLEQGTVRLTPPLADPATHDPGRIITGRVAMAGDRLLVPTVRGLLRIDPEQPEASAVMETSANGNLLCTGGQILAAEESRFSAYVTWPAAKSSLQSRLAARPNAVSLLLTYVELAHRAGMTGEAPEQAEKALEILDRTQVPGAAQPERRRLFETVHAILDEGGGQPEKPVVEAAVVDRLLRVLERSADSPGEHAAYLLRRGAIAETRTKFAQAVEAYQEILGDDALERARVAMSPEGSGGAYAHEAARARVESLVSRQGFQVYASFDQEAQRLAGELPQDAPGERFEALARRYPISRAAAGLYASAGEAYARRGRAELGVRAFANGLASAEKTLAAGVPEHRDVVASVASRLLSALQENRQDVQAARVLRRLLAKHPGIALGTGTSTLDAAGAARAIGERLARTSGRARVGPELVNDPVRPPQVLESWRLSPALIAPGGGAPTDCAVLQSDVESKVALFVTSLETGELVLAWSRAFEKHAPSPLAVEIDTTYLYWPGPEGGSVEAVDNASGATRWKLDEFSRLFPGTLAAPRAASERFSTPVGGEVRSGDLVVSLDATTLLLVERDGRAAGINLADGRLLWTVQAELPYVYDVAGVEGTLLLAGSTAGGENAEELAPKLVALDKRSGRTVYSFGGGEGEQAQQLSEHVRWLRAGPRGVVVGLSDGVMLFDAASGAAVWSSRGAIHSSGLGSVADEQVVVVDAEHRLWSLALSGEGEPKRLDLAEKVDFPVRLTPTGAGVIVSSVRGVVVVGGEGLVRGADALDQGVLLATPAVGEEFTVAVEAMADTSVFATMREPAERRAPATIYTFENATARVVSRETIILPDEPAEAMVLDGKVLISAGHYTVVIDAPVRR